MINIEISENAIKKAKKYQVKSKFDKQVNFLKNNSRHNSLDYKPLEGIKGIWRFNIDEHHYWGLVRKLDNKNNALEVYDVIKHPKMKQK